MGRIDKIDFQFDIRRYFRESPKGKFFIYDSSLENPLNLEEAENYKSYNGLGDVDTLVVKVGTSIVTHDNPSDGEYNMDRIARDLTRLKAKGLNVLLITSGAIGLGRKARIADGENVSENESKSLVQKQRDATIGQPILYDLWWNKFRIEHNQETKEFLVVNDHFLVQEKKYELLGRYQQCLNHGIIPIINEHDAKSLAEIETEFKGQKVFRDNDGLASLHARMLKEAGYKPLLILLSNTDGIYTPYSFDSKEYEPVRIVKNSEGLEIGVSPESSSRGRGGVISKIEVGRELANLGITTVIANGQYCNHEWDVEEESQFGVEYDVIDSILKGRVVGTRFLGH